MRSHQAIFNKITSKRGFKKGVLNETNFLQPKQEALWIITELNKLSAGMLKMREEKMAFFYVKEGSSLQDGVTASLLRRAPALWLKIGFLESTLYHPIRLTGP